MGYTFMLYLVEQSHDAGRKKSASDESENHDRQEHTYYTQTHIHISTIAPGLVFVLTFNVLSVGSVQLSVLSSDEDSSSESHRGRGTTAKSWTV